MCTTIFYEKTFLTIKNQEGHYLYRNVNLLSYASLLLV